MEDQVTPPASPRRTKPITLQKRRDLMDGYLLNPTGACIGDAIRTADISNTTNRSRLTRKGFVILTRHNNSERPSEHDSQPPTVEDCEAALRIIRDRVEPVLEALRAELAEADEELGSLSLDRRERGFWRRRKRDLEMKIKEIEEDQTVTATELHRQFVREDVSLRARTIPEFVRASLEAMERERALLDTYGIELDKDV
jgi:hypothetical protein